MDEETTEARSLIRIVGTGGEIRPFHTWPSVFLAGPTPRDEEVKSWRPRMLEYIESAGHWQVFIPEPYIGDEDNQQKLWEAQALAFCDILLFWVPRDLEKMPGFTTNVEFGYWLCRRPKSVVLGYPIDAPHCSYLDVHYSWATGRRAGHTMADTWAEAVERYWNLVRKGPFFGDGGP